MNLQQLDYIVAIAKYGSITRASQALFRTQPNISSALKELEEELHIIIFNRTPQGMILTSQGETLITMANQVLYSVDEIRKEFHEPETQHPASIKISLSRASYCVRALSKWVNARIDDQQPIAFDFHETNSEAVIKNVRQGISDIGIIRIPQHRFDEYASLLKSKGLQLETLMHFQMKIICKTNHPLADRKEISFDELQPYTEIIHGDDLHMEGRKRSICVYDRGSQIDLLVNIPGAFMWVSPIPMDMVENYDMIIIPCSSTTTCYQDILIYRKQIIGDFIVRDCVDFLKIFTNELVHEQNL